MQPQQFGLKDRSKLTHWKVESFSLLLVSPPFSHIHSAHVGLRGHRFNGFCGAAVLEGIRHVKVLYCQHVLQRLHGGIQGLSHLQGRQMKPCNLFSPGPVFLSFVKEWLFFRSLDEMKVTTNIFKGRSEWSAALKYLYHRQIDSWPINHPISE